MDAVGHGINSLVFEKLFLSIFSNEHVLSNISITKLIFNPVPKLDLHMNFVLALTTVAVLFLTAFA
jgi:hypothetical protein